MNRLSRIELGMALAALGLALAAGIYLIVTTFAENEACYGISARKIVCHPLTPDTAAQTATRIAVALSTVLALYVAATLAAWWQSRTRDASARVTAYMVLVVSAITVLALTLPAIEGVGFFFIPGTAVLIVATAIGLAALLSANRRPAGTDQEAR